MLHLPTFAVDLPIWSSEWRLFTVWSDLPFAIAGLLLTLLLILWWRQQTKAWLRVVLTALLAALLLTIAGYYVFVVPPHFAGCPEGCAGWRGYPLRFARYGLEGQSELAVVDFALDVLVLFMITLTAAAVWAILAVVVRLGTRGRRWRITFVLLFALAPWALLPRFLAPPAPPVEGEELRLANNALRAAEFTYSITGLWVHRLALEDVRRDLAPALIEALTAPTLDPTQDAAATGGTPAAGDPAATGDAAAAAPTIAQSAAAQAELNPTHMVCLRGYTWFFVPWARYRVALGADGATALSLTQLPLSGTCWQAPPSP